MSRTLTSAMQDALAGTTLAPLLFAQLDFDSAPVRVTNLGHDIAWNGATWLGAGYVGSVDAIVESEGVRADGLVFSLTGIPAALVAVTLTEQYQGRRVRVWLGAVAAGALVADPLLVFSGRMDNMQVVMGDTATIRVNAESRLADFERARVGRFNDADQRARDPNDTGFRYVPQLVERTLYWGNPSPPATVPLGGG